MPAPPSYQKVNPADQPILYLTLTSATLPLSDLDEYGEVDDGAADLDDLGRGAGQVYGPQKYAVRVQLDPRAARLAGIGIDEVAAGRQPAPTSTCRRESSTGR